MRLITVSLLLSSYLRNKLVAVGFTCGVSDFVDNVMKAAINGQHFYNYIVNNTKPWNGSNILALDLEQVLVLLDALKLKDVEPIKSDLKDVIDGKIQHKFINNENDFASKAHALRLKKAGGIFGYRGAKDGIKGSDCGGKQALCAQQGRELGGRKKGSKNIFSVTLELSDLFLGCLFIFGAGGVYYYYYYYCLYVCSSARLQAFRPDFFILLLLGLFVLVFCFVFK